MVQITNKMIKGFLDAIFSNSLDASHKCVRKGVRLIVTCVPLLHARIYKTTLSRLMSGETDSGWATISSSEPCKLAEPDRLPFQLSYSVTFPKSVTGFRHS
jgi:hypothetical protein